LGQGNICNRYFRNQVLELGIEWVVKNDNTLDYGYNMIRKQNKLKFGSVTGEHLVIPDIFF
jgi:hypothetical protein